MEDKPSPATRRQLLLDISPKTDFMAASWKNNRHR